jgi:hypothetical protein
LISNAIGAVFPFASILDLSKPKPELLRFFHALTATMKRYPTQKRWILRRSLLMR